MTGAVTGSMTGAVAGPGTSPLVSARELRAAPPGTLLLDATVDLPRPRVDGEHRASSGAPGWAAAHLPGARHLDLLKAFADPAAGYHFAHPTPDRAHRVLHALGARDGRPVVVYDRADGFWAARAWWSLLALGVPARVLDGGLAAWRAAGGPVVGGGPADPAPGAASGTAPGAASGAAPDASGAAPDGSGALTLRPRADAWATLADVRALVDGRRPGRLVCALGADQFHGTAPTRYARRGHIPGSTNLPARSLTGADGTLLPAPRLRAALDPLLAAGPLVLYCGGGISASHLALGLVVAGAREVSVYDGSLEEWSARPDLPLVTRAAATAG